MSASICATGWFRALATHLHHTRLFKGGDLGLAATSASSWVSGSHEGRRERACNRHLRPTTSLPLAPRAIFKLRPQARARGVRPPAEHGFARAHDCNVRLRLDSVAQEVEDLLVVDLQHAQLRARAMAASESVRSDQELTVMVVSATSVRSLAVRAIRRLPRAHARARARTDVEECVQGACVDARVLRRTRLPSAVTHTHTGRRHQRVTRERGTRHRVRLARAGLAVREDAHVVPARRRRVTAVCGGQRSARAGRLPVADGRDEARHFGENLGLRGGRRERLFKLKVDHRALLCARDHAIPHRVSSAPQPGGTCLG
jgi:hypothetical protein